MLELENSCDADDENMKAVDIKDPAEVEDLNDEDAISVTEETTWEEELTSDTTNESEEVVSLSATLELTVFSPVDDALSGTEVDSMNPVPDENTELAIHDLGESIDSDDELDSDNNDALLDTKNDSEGKVDDSDAEADSDGLNEAVRMVEALEENDDPDW